ncbi:UNVERIFIED_CONTAM: hypothetical protein GTU68_031564 [Idotea baltica]|nr:hypothetical protein [Idotea baltica]
MVGLSDFELTGIREYTRFWSMLMFGSYSVINIIVLLNLLIAMMSSSYSFIVVSLFGWLKSTLREGESSLYNGNHGDAAVCFYIILFK